MGLVNDIILEHCIINVINKSCCLIRFKYSKTKIIPNFPRFSQNHSYDQVRKIKAVSLKSTILLYKYYTITNRYLY
jgi:hypothetical protein